MITPEFRANRARFTPDALAAYQGQWVAFSGDGSRIVAAAESLERLEEQLGVAGEDPRRLVLEGIPGPEDEMSLGAEELR